MREEASARLVADMVRGACQHRFTADALTRAAGADSPTGCSAQQRPDPPVRSASLWQLFHGHCEPLTVYYIVPTVPQYVV